MLKNTTKVSVLQMPDGSEFVELSSIPVRIREFAASVPEIKDLNDKFRQILFSDQDAPENTADPKSELKRNRKVVVDEDPAHPAEFRLKPFDLNEYPTENEATTITVHAKYAPKNAEAPETSGVKKQPNGKKAAVYQNSADSDYDSSRTISDLPTESMSLNHRRYEEVVDKGTKNKSILKKRKKSFPNDGTDDITGISLTKRKKVSFNLDDDDDNNNKNKKNKKNKKLNEAESSNRKGSNGPCSSKIAVGQIRNSKPLKHAPKRLKSSHNEKVKEIKCTGLGRCVAAGGCEPSGSDSVVVQAEKVNGSGETVPARELVRETLVCTVNWNPAEFIPEIAKRFMR